MLIKVACIARTRSDEDIHVRHAPSRCHLSMSQRIEFHLYHCYYQKYLSATLGSSQFARNTKVQEDVRVVRTICNNKGMHTHIRIGKFSIVLHDALISAYVRSANTKSLQLVQERHSTPSLLSTHMHAPMQTLIYSPYLLECHMSPDDIMPLHMLTSIPSHTTNTTPRRDLYHSF